MAREIDAVLFLLNKLIYRDEKTIDLDNPDTKKELERIKVHAATGVAFAGLETGKAYLSLVDVSHIPFEELETKEMSNREILLAVRFAYREFALNLHQKCAEKAVNFKTASFAISGMTERAKEIMRIVWWCDGEIKRILEWMQRHGTGDEPEEGTVLSGGVGASEEMALIDHVLHY